MRELRPVTCSSCGRPILWAIVAASGRRMPVDLFSTSTGTVFLSYADESTVVGDGVRCSSGDLIARILSREDAQDPTVPRYVSHLETCSHAAQHRRPR